MPYGIIKIDTITFTDAGVDKSVSISGLVQNPTFTGNVTATGTISGLIVQAPTVTGTTANFASGVYTTQISGAIVKVPAGSAGAPSIQVGVGASVAPGLYGAGTDLLGISTGGAGRIFIDSTGRLGVGTSSPAQVLDVAGNGRFFVNAGSPTVSVNNGTIDHYIGVNATGGLVGTSNSYPVLFLTNNTERLRIDSSGNVGIGTSSPGAIFDVDTGNNSTIALFNSTAANGGGISLRASGTTRATLGLGANFITGASLNDVSLTSAGAVLFGNTSGIERLRIDSSGNVGIGTSSPSDRLHVANGYLRVTGATGDGSNIYLYANNATTSPVRIGQGLGTATDNIGFIVNLAAADLVLGTNNTERLRIDSSGRVGIGTSSPATALDVSFTGGMLRAGGASGNNLIQAYTGSTGLGMWAGGTTRFYSAGNITLSTNATIGTGAPTGYVDAMTIDSSGRVGIGTGSPSYALDVVSTGESNVRIKSGGAASAYLRIGTASKDFAIYADQTSSSLNFYDITATTERARIDSSGRLLVGTSTGRGIGSAAIWQSQLEGASGTGLFPGFSVTNNSNDTESAYFIFGKSRGTVVGSNTIVQTGDVIGRILFAGADGTDLETRAASIEAIVDGTPGANDMPGRLVFSTTADGAATPTERLRIDSAGRVGIGTSSPGYKLEVFGTSNANEIRSSDGTTISQWYQDTGGISIFGTVSNHPLAFRTNSSERMRIDSSGNVAIGTTNVGYGVVGIYNSSNSTIGIANATSYSQLQQNSSDLYINCNLSGAAGGNIIFRNGSTSTERLRIDPSGKLLVGTSSARGNFKIAATIYDAAQQLEAGSQGFQSFVGGSASAGGPYLMLAHQRSGTVGGNTVLVNGDEMGTVSFHGADGTNLVIGAAIRGEVDGTPGANDMPGRLVFSTTEDGSSTPAEKMRITSGGDIRFSWQSPFIGAYFDSTYYMGFSPVTSGRILYIDCVTNDTRADIVFRNGQTGVGTEKARIDSSGRLLVGSSTARSLYGQTGVLQTEGTGYASSGVNIILNNASTAGPLLMLGKSRGSVNGSSTIVQNNDTLGEIYFCGADGTDLDTPGASIVAVVDGTPGSNDMPGRLEFSTTADGAAAPTQRMRLESNGNARFSNLASIYPATDNAVANGGSGFRWSAIWAANGTIQTSDKRAKTDVSDAELGFNFIKSLRPVSYKWVEGGKVDTGERDDDGNYIYQSIPGERTHWGFIAQEVKEAVDDAGVDFGGWILTDKDDLNSQQALRYDQFIAPLTKALQEAIAKIETLEAKVAAL
jgi:hypothetical protein